MAIRFLSVMDVLALHAEMMEGMGERRSPLRDEGLLESAIFRPQMAGYYEETDLVRQAALLTVGISQNEPLIDGNKRTAYIACVTFLRINGRPFTGEPMDLAREIQVIAMRTDSLDTATRRFEQWLRQHVG